MPSGAGLTPNVLAWHLAADQHKHLSALSQGTMAGA